MVRPSSSYEPRGPAQSALYQIVLDHFETFRTQAAGLRDGEGLPRFVEQEFRRCHARQHGFDLHAGIVAAVGRRDRLERLCRYALRPPVARDRLTLTGAGQVLLQLRHRWTDGTTHLLFEPTELLERLAALTPRPRINLIVYHGVLAPRAAWRPLVVGDAVGAARRRGPTHNPQQPIEPTIRERDRAGPPVSSGPT